jgi:hypothetical protein
MMSGRFIFVKCRYNNQSEYLIRAMAGLPF